MLLELQNAVLGQVAQGRELFETLEYLCCAVERLLPGTLASVLVLDEHSRLQRCAAPSLPVGYVAALRDLPIGLEAGACGSAVSLGAPVVVADIATDRRWERNREFTLSFGLRGCFSTPVFDSKGNVLGTFALYFSEPRAPSPFEQSIVEGCVPLAMIALERHERLMEHQRLARTDFLTKLQNRASFDEALSEIAKGGRSLFLIDIDNLKSVNDTFGHVTGDDLIKIVAARIAEESRPFAAYRLSGDEFGVLLPFMSQAALEEKANAIIRSVGTTAECNGYVVFPSITVGIATSTPDDRVEDFRHRADLALYHGKESNRGGLHIYSPEIGTAISRRCDAVLRVAAALKEDRLEAWYQPIVKIDSGECVGLEALARIRNPNGTVASASEFHEATRDAHIAATLTHRMFQKIASNLGAWYRDGIAPSYVAINLSAADLKIDDISGKLELAFAAQNVPFSKAVLEITESVYLGERDRRVVEKIADLRKMGLGVALDDFGTGFASLSHLISVPIDIIKIDKSFVDRLGPEGIGNGIIEGILHIAKSLKVRVVAEGVETSEQAQFLQRMGCGYAQGYLFSKPLPSNAATRYLNAQMGRFNSTSFASPTKRRKH